MNINITNKNKLKQTMFVPNIHSSQLYDHDIGKWALVKFCNYPITTLNSNVDKIPIHVINSLK